MARLARVVVPGMLHHVTQRGNRRMDVFADDIDRERYCGFICEYAGRHGVHIWAYCLMTNHVHFVAVPEAEESLARWLRDAHTAYAHHVNRRQQQSGHLWQGRFFSCVLDEAHLWAAVRYVERNPVKAGLVRRAEAYGWSSAAAHCGTRSDPLLAPDFPLLGVVPDWSRFLESEDVQLTDEVRRSSKTGRPCGSAAFVQRMEVLLRRPLQRQRPGPKGTEKKDV